MDADQPVGGDPAELRRDDRAEVAALCAEPLVPEPRHQLQPRAGGPFDAPAGLGGGSGEREARQRGSDDVERVRGVATMAGRVGQRTYELEEVVHRARPPMRDQQRRRVRDGRPGMQEVDVLAVDRRRVLLDRVQPRLMCAPVVSGAPVVGQVAQVRLADAVRPADAGKLVRPARTFQPERELVEVGLWDVDAERLGSRGHARHDSPSSGQLPS